MQAEIKDIKSYYPDSQPGITISEVSSLLHNLLVAGSLMKQMKDMAREKTIKGYPNGDALYEYLMRTHQDNVVLMSRLMESIKIELVDQ